MLNLAISTIAFVVAAWILNRFLDEQAIPRGFKRGAMILVLASLTAWGVWRTVDWTQSAMAENPEAAAANISGASQVLKDANQATP